MKFFDYLKKISEDKNRKPVSLKAEFSDNRLAMKILEENSLRRGMSLEDSLNFIIKSREIKK